MGENILVDQSYKSLGIMPVDAKVLSWHQLIVFDKEEHAQVFAQYIAAQSIFCTSEGYLISINGYFVTIHAWAGILAEFKKRYGLSWKVV